MRNALVTSTFITLLSLLVGQTAALAAGPGCTASNHAGAACCEACGTHCQAGRLVERTIMVPTMVTEKRMKTRVIKKTVEREETYTVFERVPETQKYMKETCYLEDDVQTKEITETKCHRVKNPVVTTYAVKVPHQEIREGTCTKEVCTGCGKKCVEEPCTCVVTVEKPETRTAQGCVPDVVFETTKREISYCVKVPKKKVEFCREETVYKLVPVERTRVVQACVPEVIKEPCEVTVQKMLPKKVLCCQACCTKHGH